MDNQRLVDLLKEKKWRNISINSNFSDYTFDIVGEKEAVGKWYLLVKFVDDFNTNTVDEMKKVFVDIKQKVKGVFVNRFLLFCIIAKKVDPSLANDVEKGVVDSFGLFRTMTEGVGGIILIVDLEKKEIYGKVPKIPYVAYKFSNDFKKIIKQLM